MAEGQSGRQMKAISASLKQSEIDHLKELSKKAEQFIFQIGEDSSNHISEK